MSKQYNKIEKRRRRQASIRRRKAKANAGKPKKAAIDTSKS